ncbi:c-type cytochrome [Hyphococcus sp.]|uniref:c-type cytochrome n=1 Tax=Hyphococcus sp. TaxID=2038636 RepID=UPI003CCC385D
MNWIRANISPILLSIAAILALIPLGAVVVAYSGLYSVAASRGHPAWLNWFLETGMRQSVQHHSGAVDAPALDAPGLAQLGAAHFQGGCAPCHGAPGEMVNPLYGSMLPAPPKLETYAPNWSDEELFWIVKHGIQYAGMPAWSGTGRDDEIWPVVAFLRQLPTQNSSQYLQMAKGNVQFDPYEADALIHQGRTTAALTACARCHDTPAAAPTSSQVPRLAGQPADYLAAALRQYRNDSRQSGMMEPVAAEMNDEDIQALAEFYATMSSPLNNSAAPQDQNAIERGRVIANEGFAAGRVPPCQSCHGEEAVPAYPRLAGQSADYMEGQLELWRNDGRAQTQIGALMAEIAVRLSPEQAADVSAYYQSLAPARAANTPLSPPVETNE